jgi:hypothetical protein
MGRLASGKARWRQIGQRVRKQIFFDKRELFHMTTAISTSTMLPSVQGQQFPLSANPAEKGDEQSVWSQRFKRFTDEQVSESSAQDKIADTETFEGRVALQEHTHNAIMEAVQRQLAAVSTSRRAIYYKEVLDPMTAMVEANRNKLNALFIGPDNHRAAELRQKMLTALDQIDAAIADCKKNCDADASAVDKQSMILLLKAKIILNLLNLDVKSWASEAAGPSNTEAEPRIEVNVQERKPDPIKDNVREREQDSSSTPEKQNPSGILAALQAFIMRPLRLFS